MVTRTVLAILVLFIIGQLSPSFAFLDFLKSPKTIKLNADQKKFILDLQPNSEYVLEVYNMDKNLAQAYIKNISSQLDQGVIIDKLLTYPVIDSSESNSKISYKIQTLDLDEKVRGDMKIQTYLKSDHKVSYGDEIKLSININ